MMMMIIILTSCGGIIIIGKTSFLCVDMSGKTLDLRSAGFEFEPRRRKSFFFQSIMIIMII